MVEEGEMQRHPVEKFSPPSDTDESKLRKTFSLMVSGTSSGVPSDGIRWTRRRASNLCILVRRGRSWDDRSTYYFTIFVLVEYIEGRP